MEDIKQKRLEFLEDTIKYYSEDINRRATTDESTCQYLTSDNRRCAIGRHLSEELCRQLDNESTTGVSHDPIYNSLPSNLKALGKQFLTEIQELHDSNIFWDDNGLTEYGQDKVDRIKKRHIEG